jgi:hypothetical protein
MSLTSPTRFWGSRLLREYTGIRAILLDRDLAKLGDAYVNLAYSLAESCRLGRGSSLRASSKVLAEALKRAGLRVLLPRRTSTHDQADAIEALVAYAWLTDTLMLEECVSILSKPVNDSLTDDDEAEPFARLTNEIIRRLAEAEKPSQVPGD